MDVSLGSWFFPGAFAYSQFSRQRDHTRHRGPRFHPRNGSPDTRRPRLPRLIEDGERRGLGFAEAEGLLAVRRSDIMPRMGGPATAPTLLAGLPNLSVLFTSGYSESAASSRVQLPSWRYLQKPYSPTAPQP
jgi:hypothetical protein